MGKDIWDKARGILKQVAPTLGTAIGGPFGGIAARAISAALTGKASDNADAAAEALLAASPEQLVALKAAELDFAVNMKALDLDEQKLAADDRASARRMAVDTGTMMPTFIALAALCGFFGILSAMIFVEIPVTAETPLNVMLGALSGLILSIGNYYFGSSAGSTRKNEMLDKILEKRG
jgi:hypothetical protein